MIHQLHTGQVDLDDAEILVRHHQWPAPPPPGHELHPASRGDARAELSEIGAAYRRGKLTGHERSVLVKAAFEGMLHAPQLREAPKAAAPSARSWPGWERDQELTRIYTAPIREALSEAADQAMDLAERWAQLHLPAPDSATWRA